MQLLDCNSQSGHEIPRGLHPDRLLICALQYMQCLAMQMGRVVQPGGYDPAIKVSIRSSNSC